jgi:integrase
VGVFLRGTCKQCGKPFFTSQRKCPKCQAAVEGIYWYKFRFEGKRYEESTRLTNQKAAERFEQRKREELRMRRAGLAPAERPPLFEDYAAKFLAWSTVEHRKVTHALHEDNINTLKRYFSEFRLDEITPAMVQNFKECRAHEPRQNALRHDPTILVSGATVNRALTTLRLLFERAAREEVWLGRNPTCGVKHFPESQRQRILTFEEQERYLKAANQTLRDIMVLMTEMGFRPQDLKNLEVANVDIPNLALNLWPLPGPGEKSKDGKTPSARRSVPITAAMLPIIERRLNRAAELKTRWMFPSRRNPQQHIADVHKLHSETLKKAGIEGSFRIYDFRHTGLTRLHEAGLQDLTLMRIAGHTKLQMTSRYIHISDEAKRDAVKKLEEYKRAHLVRGKAS